MNEIDLQVCSGILQTLDWKLPKHCADDNLSKLEVAALDTRATTNTRHTVT